MRLVWCSCGWELRLVVSADPEMALAMPVMVDHWRDGHTLRVWGMIRRSFALAAADYAIFMAQGMPRAVYEDKLRARVVRANQQARRDREPDFEPFRP